MVTHLVASDAYTDNEESARTGVLNAFEDLCYRATEAFDVYALTIPKAINLKPDRSLKQHEASYREVVKKRRSKWALICNKLKHNHNVLVPIKHRSVDTGAIVRGFALCKPSGADKLVVNSELHGSRERSIQFDVAVRQIVHDLLRCDIAAATILKQLPDNGVETVDYPSLPLRASDVLLKLARRVVLAGEKQPTMFDGYTFSEEYMHLERQQAVRLSGRTEISVIYHADGMTRTFELI